MYKFCTQRKGGGEGVRLSPETHSTSEVRGCFFCSNSGQAHVKCGKGKAIHFFCFTLLPPSSSSTCLNSRPRDAPLPQKTPFKYVGTSSALNSFFFFRLSSLPRIIPACLPFFPYFHRRQSPPFCAHVISRIKKWGGGNPLYLRGAGRGGGTTCCCLHQCRE